MPIWNVDDALETTLDDLRRVAVRLVNGDVSVTAGDGPARLEVAREEGAAVEVRFEDGELRIAQPDWTGPGWRRSFERWVGTDEPLERLNLTWIGRLFGPRQRAVVSLVVPPEVDVDVTTVTAPVLISGVAGTVRTRSVTGDHTLAGLPGNVDAKTVSGNVDASQLAGEFRAVAVSGDVSAARLRSRAVFVKTVSGSIALDLDVDPEGVYEVSTVSGDVGLRLPDDLGAVVQASSVSGSIDGDFGLRWTGDRPGIRRLREAIGSGGARLYLRTVSGPLRLIRRQGVAA